MAADTNGVAKDDVGGFDPGHFDSLVAAEDRHFWFRVRNHTIAAAYRQLIRDLPPGYRVIDVGCGTGNVLRMLERESSGGEVVGIELFGEGVEHARRRVRSPVMVGELREQHFEKPFDIVGMFDVLEHIDDDAGELERVRSVLTASGRLLITVPAHPDLWSDFDVASHHHRRYTETSLRAVLGRSGFTVEYLTPFMSLLYPMMRLRHRSPTSDTVEARGVVDRAFRVIPVANSLGYAALRWEALAVARRWRLPMGTSLLAVARVSPGH
jgi:SAM-dependent methyltransferase